MGRNQVSGAWRTLVKVLDFGSLSKGVISDQSNNWSTYYVPGRVVLFLLETWASGEEGSSYRLLHLLQSVPRAPATAHPEPSAALASGCPLGQGAGVLGLNAAPERPERNHCILCYAVRRLAGWAALCGLAASDFSLPCPLPGSWVMSPRELWPLHGFSWGQRLGPESVPLGETWSDKQGGTKGSAIPQGLASVKLH